METAVCSVKPVLDIQEYIVTSVSPPCLFSWGRWTDILTHGRFKRPLKEADVEKICRALLAYCLLHYRGDENIKSFIWDLITPSEDGTTKTLTNHSGNIAPPKKLKNEQNSFCWWEVNTSPKLTKMNKQPWEYQDTRVAWLLPYLPPSPPPPGLSTPVPRGRKGKKGKPTAPPPQTPRADWLASCNPDHLLQEDSYKRHLKHHCNK